MQLRDYFSTTVGTGVMATASESGEVDTALYASPHFISDDTVAFIMRDRLTRANLQTNPRANYMFIEHTHGFKGMRLFLQMIEESTDQDAIESLSRRNVSEEQNKALGQRFLVTFKVVKALQLVGGKEISIE